MGIQKDRMLAGELYIADDPELAADNRRAMALMERFNATPAASGEVRREIFRELLGAFGDGSEIRTPIYCDYGQYISIGNGAFINFGAMLIDVAPITIGNDCQLGPNVQLLTPLHPVEPGPRREKWESAKPITLQDNVWLGGGVIVLPSVTIGENSVVGAGAVVTKDLAANVVAAGNPARVVRKI